LKLPVPRSLIRRKLPKGKRRVRRVVERYTFTYDRRLAANFAHALVALRAAHRISRHEVCLAFGMVDTRLKDIETGRTGIKVHEWLALSHFYRVDPLELLAFVRSRRKLPPVSTQRFRYFPPWQQHRPKGHRPPPRATGDFLRRGSDALVR
jgi:hypothetical protein